MDFGELKNSLGAIALIFSIGTTLYTFITFRSKNNSGKLTELEAKVNSNTTDITALENEFKHLPNSNDVVELKLSLSEMNGVVGKLATNMSNMSRVVNRTEEYLLSKGKGK